MDDLQCRLCDQMLATAVVRTCCGNTLCIGCNLLSHDQIERCVFCNDDQGRAVRDVRLNEILMRRHGDASERIILMADMLKMDDEEMSYAQVLEYWGIPPCHATKMMKTMEKYEKRVRRKATTLRATKIG